MRNYLVFMLTLLVATDAFAAEIKVATAANFRKPLLEIAALFEARGDHTLKISSASTGVIYNQLLNGAPFDVFLAADSLRPALLEQQGLVLASGRFTYAWGQLVLAYRAANPNSLSTLDLASALNHPGITVAIANPDHAPYGRAAQQVLDEYPLAAGTRLVRATNVGQAFRMWHSGSADLALVAPSFAPDQYLEIPRASYSPIEQQVVVLKNSRQREAASEFADFLRQAQAQDIIVANGYRVSGND